MKDLRNLVGLPVICDGKRIGRAASVELSQDLTQMAGLVVDCGIRGSRFIAAQDVELMGEVSIITNRSGRRTSAPLPLRRRALSTDGSTRGAVSGAMIDEASGKVEALLLSMGYIDDLLTGRRWIRRYQVQEESGNVIFDEGEKGGE